VTFLLLLAGGAGALEEEAIPVDEWTVEAARRAHSLAPFTELDPWTLPMTRGALAREVAERRRLAAGGSVSPALRGLLEELADELAPEIVSLAEGRGERSAVSAKGTFAIEGRDRRRGAARAVLHGDLAVRLNPHVFWHQRVRIDTRAADDPSFLGSEWKEGITGHFTHAYAAFRLPRVRATAGRRPVAWGNGLSGALLLQGAAPPLDQIGADVRWGPLTAHAFVAALDDLPIEEKGESARRYLSGHRLSLRLGSLARLALSETVVYGGKNRAFDWEYANPLMVYYAIDWNNDGDDNVLWSIDAYLRAHPTLDLFGELLVDDFQYDRTTEPNQIGFLIGARAKEIPRLEGVFFDAEYVRVHNWVYGHEMPWNRYTHGRALLGHMIGPDADRILLRLSVRRGRSWEVLLEHEHRREGEGSIDDPREGAVPHGTEFLTGEVTTLDLPALEVRVHPRAARRFFVRVERDRDKEWVPSMGASIRFSGTREGG